MANCSFALGQVSPSWGARNLLSVFFSEWALVLEYTNLLTFSLCRKNYLTVLGKNKWNGVVVKCLWAMEHGLELGARRTAGNDLQVGF